MKKILIFFGTVILFSFCLMLFSCESPSTKNLEWKVQQDILGTFEKGDLKRKFNVEVVKDLSLKKNAPNEYSGEMTLSRIALWEVFLVEIKQKV